MKKVALDVKNISFSYLNQKALNDVSFRTDVGSLLGIVGPNGGGKTTLFKILSGLIRNFEGQVSYFGLEMKKDRKKILKNIGVVFQSPSLDKKLTVEENIRYHGRLYGLSADEIEQKMSRLLKSLQIEERRSHRVDTLSGGTARRVEIAKSLLHSPSLLILDEPTTGLDIKARMDFWNILEKVREENQVTVLLTTHYIEEADRCDEIVLLNQGKVVEFGSPAKLKKSLDLKRFQVKPQNLQRTLEFLQSCNIQPVEKNGVLAFSTPVDQAEHLIQQLSRTTQELTYRDASLEDLFLARTGREFAEVRS